MSYIDLLKDYYPIYKSICRETGEKPCLHGFGAWILNSENILENRELDADEIKTIDLLHHLRSSDIASKGWETKKQQELTVIS